MQGYTKLNYIAFYVCALILPYSLTLPSSGEALFVRISCL